MLFIDYLAAHYARPFDLTLDELRCRSRRAILVRARRHVMIMLRTEHGFKLIAIARCLGLHHSTVLHHLQETGHDR